MNQTPRQLLIKLVSEDLWIANEYSELVAQFRIEEMLRGAWISAYDAEVLATYRPVYLALSDRGVSRLINDVIRSAKQR